jgi:hypothetical protein
MNKNIFTLTIVIVVALSLVLAACTPAAVTALPATPATAIAQSAAAAAAFAQLAVSAATTALPAAPAAATALPAAPAAATALPATPAAATALPAAPAAATTQPNAATGQTIPVFSGLQPLAANDPKAIFFLNTANQMAQKTGFQFDGKAYVTNAKVEDITAFYNNALKDWKATPPSMSSYPIIGNVTIWVYSQTSQQETLTIAYSAYDAAATKFLVITELLWK